MPRLPLIHIPNGIYSVVSKCNNGEFLFDATEKFELYLQHLLECQKYFGFILYDIVCMSNHVHELYRIPENISIAQILQRVKGLFTKKFNKRFGRSNHFWKNKPFYRIIEDERYGFNTMNYFHWNPVKAGLVRNPAEWPFSGYRFHILKEKNSLIGQLLSPIDCRLHPEENYRIWQTVESAFKNQRTRYVGSDNFKREMEQRFGRCPTLGGV